MKITFLVGHGATGYVAAMARAVPLAIIKPVIGISNGTTKVIQGAKNAINKQEKEVVDNKYGRSARDTVSKT